MFLLNRATKRPQRPSHFLGLNSEEYPDSTLVDFDLSVELFDLWYEERANATIEKPAPQNRTPMIHEPKYRTVLEILGLEGSEIELSDEEKALAEMLNSGSMDDPSDLIRVLEEMERR
jgi:hypothetical protein